MAVASRSYATAVFGLEHTIARVPPDAWDQPSPCDGWTVRDIAGHAIGVVRNITARANGETATDAFTDVGSIAGPDPLVSMRRHCTELLVALDQTGVLERPVVSLVGTHTTDSYMAFMRSDALVHCWDIATACGFDPMLDPAMLALVLVGGQVRRRLLVTQVCEQQSRVAKLADRLQAEFRSRPRHRLPRKQLCQFIALGESDAAEPGE